MKKFDDYTYYRQLAKKRMASGVLLFDEQERFLVLKPDYKDTWEIPGGVVELYESPIMACIREVFEETGLVLDPDDLFLLCLEYAKGDEIRTESLKFVFGGGTLSDEQISSIKLDTEEVLEYRFVTLEEAGPLLFPPLWNRLKQALKARNGSKTAYFEA